MARRMRRASDIQQKYAQSAPTSFRRSRLHEKRGGMDFMEVLAMVCKYFCQGHTAPEIKEIMLDKHGVSMPREEPYQLVAHAASRGWIRFVAPHEYALREQIKRQCSGWLQDVDVVHTSVFDDVAMHGAEMLMELLRRHHSPPYSKEAVHVGFAGGHAMRMTAQAFARLLGQAGENLPGTVVFHAMVAGFDVQDPTTDPNAFFTYFVSNPAIQIEAKFVGLHAPAVVLTRQLRELKDLDGIRETFASSEDLDIIVTSGSCWDDPHSMLRKYMMRSEKSFATLQQADCIGDMLWRPISPSGPISQETEIRAMTLVELTDLPRFIQRGKHVLLVLGPCMGCNNPKTATLEAVIAMHPHLITHLVVDSRTARSLFKTE